MYFKYKNIFISNTKILILNIKFDVKIIFAIQLKLLAFLLTRAIALYLPTLKFFFNYYYQKFRLINIRFL